MRARLLIVLCAAAASVVLLVPNGARGAGMISHAFMADEAIERVTIPELQAFLVTHRHEVLSGASYPDGGYVAGGYGEISHWERFIDGYVAELRERGDCPDLSDQLGICAPMVAHVLGAAAHGMGDETWDWMFEPLVADHGEVPEHPLAPPELNGVIGNIEYAMDTIALVDYFRWGESGYYVPPPNQLTPIYERIGRSDINEAGLIAGHAGGSAALTAERLGGVADSERVREQMPWSSANFHDESGGIQDSADAIAGYYEAVWQKLLDDTPPPPRVVGVHPEPDETEVPYEFHPAKTSPGPHTGGGELRIIAVLSNAVDQATVTSENFKLLEPDGTEVEAARGRGLNVHEAAEAAGDDSSGHGHSHGHSHGSNSDFGHGAAPAGHIEVDQLGGFPRPGPYGPTDGTHSIMLYPAEDLVPCTTYTALVTTGLQDMAELPINTGQGLTEDHSWSFRTRSADGNPCPPPPDPDPDPDPEPDPNPDPGPGPGPGPDPGPDPTPDPGPGPGPGPEDDSGAPIESDPPVCAGLTATIFALGERGVKLVGTPGDDVIVGGPGDDEIEGRGGDDVICGLDGDDLIKGRGGDDTIFSGAGKDRIRGNGGADEIRANRDDDRLNGGRGKDLLQAGAGNDRLGGGPGRDRLKGNAGDDFVRGNVGRDRCNGGTGSADRAVSCERQVGFP